MAKLLWMAVNFGIGPVEHTAVHRHWARLYGSMVVSVTGDVIQCFVERPPKTKDEALFLAIEQFKYCSDIVDQGVGTICNLAAELLNSHTWYFWWD
ncbi:MAG: DUF4253 domain-containing protein [Planctomycetes bacterium]|nr:DUF4253 domain-containing protein [Planctomycetota bacterium]